MSPPLSRLRTVPRRLLGHDEACQYLGISATLFDRGVQDCKLPKPIWFYTRKLWDIRALDLAIDAMAGDSTDEAASKLDPGDYEALSKPLPRHREKLPLRPMKARKR